MGFFFIENKSADKHLKGLSPEFLRKHGCAVCPLNEQKDLQSPKMLPTGSKQPTVVMVGGSPSVADDQSGKHFSGSSGRLLKDFIPAKWKDRVQFTNIVNCRIAELDNVAQQCCAPRFEKAIVAGQPKAIFGFGAVPLFNLTKQSGIGIWRGRRLPVEIGGHACWYYPILHPTDIMAAKHYGKRYGAPYGSDDEFAFIKDLERAFAELDSLSEPIIHTIEEVTSDIEIVDNVNRIADLLAIVANDPSTGLDIETNCLRPYTKNAKILSIAFASKSATFAFALDHSQASWSKLERKQIDKLLKDFLYEAQCRKIVHHLPFELEWLGFFYGQGCFYAGRWECSESGAYVLDARRGGLSLDFLCLQYFGFNIKSISGLDRKNLDKSPLNQVLKYNAIDARYHRLLWLEEYKRIKQEKLQDVYKHQMRRIPSLVLMQLQGVPVDQTIVESLKKKYQAKADAAAKDIASGATVKEFEKRKGKKFNPSSSQDVNYLLKEIVGVDLESTAKGELAHVDHPIAKKIVAWREPNKVLSTYIESIDAVSKETNLFSDGLLHPIIGTTRVITWRTNCVKGNTLLETSYGSVEISKLDLDLKHKNSLILTHEGRWKRITKLWYKGKSPMFIFTFASGQKITCTAGHEFFTGAGWKRAGSFAIGDSLVSHKSFSGGCHSRPMGFLEGIGEKQKHFGFEGIGFRNDISASRNDVKGSFKDFWFLWKDIRKFKAMVSSYLWTCVKICQEKELFESFVRKQSWRKRFPTSGDSKRRFKSFGGKGIYYMAYGYDVKNISLLRGEMFEIPQNKSTGSLPKKASWIYSTGFFNFGNVGSCFERFAISTGLSRARSEVGARKDVFGILATNCSATSDRLVWKAFCQQIASAKGILEQKCGGSIFCFRTRKSRDRISPTVPFLEESKKQLGGFLLAKIGTCCGSRWFDALDGWRQKIRQCDEQKSVASRKKSISDISCTSTNNPEDDFRFHFGITTIVQIEPAGIHDVWDITVEGDHSYVAHGVVNHNSDSPNIQNFPKHNNDLKEVRSQIKSSDPNMVIVSVDYAGIQARNVAMESKDKKLVDAYWHNYDIHSDWRDRILKHYPKWMTKEQRDKEKETKEFRQIAKNKFVFATFFGAQSYTTSEGLKVPKEICEALREEFFDEFPDIEKWHKNLQKFYNENGYVAGLSGFRRRAPVSGTEIVNTPIQSDESVIVLDAAVRLSEMQDPRYQPILEVHDDLTFLMPRREVERRLEVIVKAMINVPFEWANIVPIEVEASWGPDWLNMTKIGSYANNKWNGIVEIK